MLQGCKQRHRRVAWAQACVLLAVLGSGVPAVAASAGAAQNAPPQTAQVDSTPVVTAAQRAEFARAESAAQRILAGAEFQRPEPTLWDRLKAKIVEAIIRIFSGIDRMTTQSPWLGRAMEWLFFIAAAVGLLVWVLRTVQRQRLRVALGGEPAKSAAWARETEDWLRTADQKAAKGSWREAIHALYWAAIVHLEQRRAWRHNPARTPREYVRLLKAGSAEQVELRGLTNELEQSWYGQRETDAGNFSAAKESFERLAKESAATTSAGGHA